MYKALGITFSKTDNNLGPCGTYTPVGGYGRVPGGDKTLWRTIKPEIGKEHVGGVVDSSFKTVVGGGFRE